MQHVPTKLLTDEQRLRNKKLEAEIEQVKAEADVTHEDVQIVDDLEADESADHTAE